jgi:hypothetical protein
MKFLHLMSWLKCIICLSILLLVGCVADSLEEESFKLETIHVELNEYISVSAREFWSATTAIPLQLVPEGAIDKVQKISVNKQLMVIYNVIDGNNTKSILLFDQDGRFQKRIDANQPGPGNFSYMQDFYLHGDTLIEIMDNIRAKTFFYDTSGIFIRAKNLGVPAIRFAPVGSKYLLYRGNAIYFDELSLTDNLLMIDTTAATGEMESRAPVKEVFADRRFDVSGFFFPETYKDAFLFCDIANDTIYECTANGITPKYLLKFSNKNIREASIERLEKEKSKQNQNFNFVLLEWMNNTDIIKMPELILSRKDDIFFWFRFKGLHHVFHYDKSKETGQLFRLENIRLWPIWYGTGNETLMVVALPSIQKELLKKQDYPVPDAVRVVFDDVNENSNPVVLKINMDSLIIAR